MKKHKGSILIFPKLSTFLTHSISLGTKSRLNLASEKNYDTYVSVDKLSNKVVTLLTPKNASHAVTSLIQHWISKFVPPQQLITGRWTEYLNIDIAKC